MHLQHAPYDWNAVERELGLFRLDGSPKPVMREMEAFSKFVENFAYPSLPQRIVDGICILSRGQDYWANAYMSFTLAKQAGLDLEFAYSDQELPDAPLYLLPGICGDAAITARRMRQLLDKVKAGALLYISLDDGLLSGMESFCGVRSKGRERLCANKAVTFDLNEAFTAPLYFNYKLELETCGAQVLACDEEGIPVCTKFSVGKGAVVLMAAPLEMMLARQPGRILEKPEYYRIYRYLYDCTTGKKVARVEQANVGITEHVLDNDRRILVLVNYDPEPAQIHLSLSAGWNIQAFHRGTLLIPGNDCTVLEIHVK